MNNNQAQPEWKKMPFTKLIDKKKYRIGKIKRKNYLDQGKHPIIDQGQGFIAGYSNEDDFVYDGELPIILFGDHTRFFKFIDFPFIAGADGTQLIVPKKDIITAKYFYYALLNTPLISRGYSRHFSLLKQKYIPVPPLVEQRGIAEVLGTVDEAIRLTDQVIERTEALKRGLMQRLLTQGIGHTEFKDTPLGRIPKTWKLSSIGTEFYIGTGGTPKRSNPEYYNGTIPWVKSTEINQDTITSTEEHLTKEGIANSNASIYPSGTLLIAMYGQGTTRGKSALLCIDASINQALAAIVKKTNKINTKFLKYWLDFNYDKIRSLGQGANQSNLNLQIIKSIKLPIPPIDEQKRIEKILENQDNIIHNEEVNKSFLLKVKHGLMQLLLSGKVRVELREDGVHRVGDGREANS